MEIKQLKETLNNLILLKWVRKFSADNLLEDNKLAKDKFNIETDEDSISILDTTATKLFVTKAEFKGEEYVRFNLKQLNELIEIAGKEGELIIPKNSDMKEMIAQIGKDLIIVCPLPKKDTAKN